MAFALARVPLLATTSVAIFRGICQRPNAKTAQAVRASYAQDPIERLYMVILDILPAAVQTWVWIPLGAEMLLTIAQKLSLPWAPRILDILTFGHPARALGIGRTFPTALIAGTAMAVYGSYFRRAAYRALGPQFTYELSSRREDKLVTKFPYSVVRHPSYTGGMLTVLGHGVAFLSRGGWLQACVWPWLVWDAGGTARALVGACAAPLAVSYATVFVGNFTRLPKEDDMMRKQFGAAWVEWASRVRSKVIPGVF